MNYITIYDEKNNELQMELVTTFELEGYNYKYIIYKEIDNSHFYLAKYKDNIDELDTNITDKELKLCQAIFEGVMNDGKK